MRQGILILGPTGSGKTPLGDLVEREELGGRRFLHFDFGRELRRVLEQGLQEGFSKGEREFVRGVLEEGLLLEDRHFPLARKILHAFERRRRMAPEHGLLLNGLPRHEGQARDMEALVTVRACVCLDCDAGTVFERLARNTGGDRAGRNDDGRALVERKLRIYRERTAPLVAHYRRRGAAVLRLPVAADDDPAAVHRRFRKRIAEFLEGG